MKLKRLAALMMTGLMAVSVVACGGNNNSTQKKSDATDSKDGIISYADLDLDKDCKDLSAEISFFNNRTDLDSDDYKGTNWKQYIEAFNKEFPNI